MPCSSASWSFQRRKAKKKSTTTTRFNSINWSILCSLNFLQTLKCFCAENLLLDFESLLLPFSSCSFAILVFVRLADDMNMWKVINCIDKQQIGALASKSASVFIESSNANSDFVHQTQQNRREKKSKHFSKRCLATVFVVVGWCFCFSGEKSHSKLISWATTVQYTWFR